MARIRRSLPLAILIILVVGVPAAAQTPIPVPSPLPPDALTASWVQVVARPDGGTDIVVGRLGGVAWTALSVDTDVRTFGPVRGQLLAWWREGDRTIVRTIDRDGRARELARTPDRIGAAALSPDGDRWYWVTLRPNGGLAAVFRARTYPEHPDTRTRLARGRRQTPDRMVWLGSERLLGIVARTPIGYRLDTLDTTSRQWTASPYEGAQRVIGLSGDALVAGTTTPDGAVGAPLVAIDRATGGARPISTAAGTGAFVTETGDVVWDEVAAGGTSTIWSASDPQLPRRLADVAGPGLVLASPLGAAMGTEDDAALLAPDGSFLGTGDETPVTLVEVRTAKAATFPTVTPMTATGAAWQAVEVGVAARGAITAAVAWRGQVVALGRDETSDRSVTWASPDGLRWTRHRFPAPTADGARPSLLATNGPRLLAAGIDDRDRSRIVLWTSADATHWTRLADQPAFHPPKGGSALYANLLDAGYVGGRWVVTGQECIEGCRDPFVLVSEDGRRWVRRSAPDTDRVIVGRDRLLAVTAADGGAGEQRISASRNGRSWTVLGTMPPAGYDGTVIDAASGLVLLASDRHDTPTTIWRSDDGSAWEPTLDVGPLSLEAVAIDGDIIVAVGDLVLDPERDVVESVSLISLDGGRTWAMSTGWMLPRGANAMTVVVAGGSALAAGWSPLRDEPAVWVTSLTG